MPKQRTGYTFEENGKWYARFDYTDSSGKRRRIKRLGGNKTQAKEMLKQILREFEEIGESILASDRMTFGDLANYFESHYLIPAQYVDGRKVAGIRSLVSAKSHLAALKEHFSNRKLRSITHGDIEKFKAKRLATPTKTGEQRAIASVNRELAMLSRILKVAHAEGWLIRNPFEAGRSPICLADEQKRERVISFEEETKMLAACIGPRTHLRPIIITAIDTGMRRGEILKLKWSDIDFANQIITVRAFNTKTMRERQIAMTERLAQELESIYTKSPKEPDTLCFGIADNVKRSFDWVRKAANLPDVRFHDLRHTHATRLVSAHIPLSEVGRILGHTQANTTFRYVNASLETARKIATALNQFNKSKNGC